MVTSGLSVRCLELFATVLDARMRAIYALPLPPATPSHPTFRSNQIFTLRSNQILTTGTSSHYELQHQGGNMWIFENLPLCVDCSGLTWGRSRIWNRIFYDICRCRFLLILRSCFFIWRPRFALIRESVPKNARTLDFLDFYFLPS